MIYVTATGKFKVCPPYLDRVLYYRRAENVGESNPMTDTYVLALDIGTSSVRAILFDSRGDSVKTGQTVLGSQIKYSQTTTFDGGVEVDAEKLLALTVSCLAKAVVKIKRAKKHVSAVGISCFWHSLVGVGDEGRAVTPVYSWADTRSAGKVAELRKLFDDDAYHKISGAELHPCFWPAKLLWLRSNHTDLYNSVKRWMGFAEYLFLRLFNDGRSSISMASGTGLFNQQAAEWDRFIINTLGLEIDTLPVLSSAGPEKAVVGEYKAALAQFADIPWFPAVGDGAASNVGSGGSDDRRLVLNVGTSAAMRVVVPSPKDAALSIKKGLFCYRVDEERVIFGGAFANGGNVYAWLKDTLLWHDDAAMAAKIARIKPDSHGLTVLPYWAGERSPGWRAGARAAILGMNLNTSPEDIVRATLESISYSFNEIRVSLHEQFPLTREIALSGGAIGSSPLLGQIICDVFGVPLVTGKVAEASSRGAALIALKGIGAISSLTDAPFEKGKLLRPSKAAHELYVRAIERFEKYNSSVIEPTSRI